MKTKTLQNQLEKYLTIDRLSEIFPYPDKRNIKDWHRVGVKLRIKKDGKWTNKWSKPIILPVLRPESTVLINPKDLVKFLEKSDMKELIQYIPSYMRIK